MQPAYKQNLEKRKDSSGITAKVNFPAGVVLYEFTGDFFTKEQLPKDNNSFIQIGKDLFLGSSGDFDDYIGHNCNPNAYLTIVGKRAILKSLNYIKIDSDVNIDYSITSTQTKDEWEIDCQCNPFRCRKKISGFQYLDEEKRYNANRLGIVPKYVLDFMRDKK